MEIQDIFVHTGIQNVPEKLRLVMVQLWCCGSGMGAQIKKEREEFVLNMRNSVGQNLPLLCWIPLAGSKWLAVFEDADIIPCFQLLVGLGENTKAHKLSFYVSDPTDLAHLHDSYEKIVELARNNISGYAGVYEYAENSRIAYEGLKHSETLSVHRWKGWIIEGKEELICEEVTKYLDIKEAQRLLDRTTLILILQLLSSAFYSLEDDGMREIMSSPEVLRLYEKSTDSKDDMNSYIHKIAELHIQHRNECGEDAGQLLVRKIKNYVNTHIGNRLKREEISEVFFISKDYVSHLFRKYESISFTQYVNECKMKKASEMLLKTGLPVNVIASSVGISEYSYFSKVFKDYTGMSANDFRNAARKSN